MTLDQNPDPLSNALSPCLLSVHLRVRTLPTLRGTKGVVTGPALTLVVFSLATLQHDSQHQCELWCCLQETLEEPQHADIQRQEVCIGHVTLRGQLLMQQGQSLLQPVQAPRQNTQMPNGSGQCSGSPSIFDH